MLKEVKQTLYDHANLTLDEYDYSEWYQKKSGDDEKLNDLLPLEVDEEKSVPSTIVSKGVKKGIGLNISTSNKLLNKFIVLLAHIKAGSDSYKLKKTKKLEKYFIFCVNTVKSPKIFTSVQSIHYNNGKQQTCYSNITQNPSF